MYVLGVMVNAGHLTSRQAETGGLQQVLDLPSQLYYLDYPGLQNEPASKLKKRNYMNELAGFPSVHLSYF